MIDYTRLGLILKPQKIIDDIAPVSFARLIPTAFKSSAVSALLGRGENWPLLET